MRWKVNALTDMVCDGDDGDARVGGVGTAEAGGTAARRASLQREAEARLEQWMKDYGEAVWSFVFTILNDHALTDDVSQEVFIRAYTHMNSFRQDSTVKTWLFSIAKNLCRDVHKSWTARKVSVTDRLDKLVESTGKGPGLIEANAILNWQLNQVWEAVLSLRSEYREVVVLRVREELSFQEIAQVMSISESTARVRYHRAIEKLRKNLAKERFGNEL